MVSETVRTSTVRTLTDQYQRLALAKAVSPVLQPVQRPLASPSTAPVSAQESTSTPQRFFDCPEAVSLRRGTLQFEAPYSCSKCYFGYKLKPGGNFAMLASSIRLRESNLTSTVFTGSTLNQSTQKCFFFWTKVLRQESSTDSLGVDSR
jgi:hypothetical protein